MSSLIVISLIIFSCLFILYELIPMVRKRDWRTLMVSSLFLMLPLAYGIDYAFNLGKLPNPNKTLFLVQPVSERFEMLLHVES